MTLRKCLLILTASALTAPAFAAPPSLAVNSPTSPANTAQGVASPIVVTFTNSTAPTIAAAGFQFRLAYTNTTIAFPSLAAANVVSVPAGIVCNQLNPTTLSCGGFSAMGDFPASVTVTIQTQTLAAGSSPLTLSSFFAFDGATGDPIAGGTVGAPGTYTVTGAVTPVGPSIAYNPAAGAAAGTGGPVNFTGVTTPGTTGAGQIVATPSGGSVAGTTTTVGNFMLSGADAANFAVTSAATLTFMQGTNTPQNINLTCTSGAAARTANLQATETITGGATSQRFWVLNCPAGSAVMATPPTITYVPAINSSTSIPAGNSTTINVGCPTDGAACNGAGTGLPATSRLENVRATYAGPMFSPIPVMACQFVSEAGTPTGAGTLDFVALTADSGDIRCTCPANTSGLPTEPFTVQVDERIPANSGAITATRNFTIVCGGPPVECGTATYVNQAPGATINLNNGGAAVQVSSVSLVGGSLNVNQTVTCLTSNVSAGSTFTVTTAPSPLVISTNPALGGTISATCTNTETTTGTATLTCTGTSALPNCASTTTFTLSCPGQGVPPPPPGEFVAVPSLNEQGRILLAALVLLLGLGVVGFRMRG